MLTTNLVFLQGDDARNVFDYVMYPKGNSTGYRTERKVIQYLLGYTSDDTEIKIEELDTANATGMFVTKDHVLVWNYPYCWISLELRVSKKRARELIAA
jgi:hypothetical protein